MPRFHTIKEGDVLHDNRRHDHWTVKVLELRENGAMVSWNRNRPEFYTIRSLEKLRRKPKLRKTA